MDSISKYRLCTQSKMMYSATSNIFFDLDSRSLRISFPLLSSIPFSYDYFTSSNTLVWERKKKKRRGNFEYAPKKIPTAYDAKSHTIKNIENWNSKGIVWWVEHQSAQHYKWSYQHIHSRACDDSSTNVWNSMWLPTLGIFIYCIRLYSEWHLNTWVSISRSAIEKSTHTHTHAPSDEDLPLTRHYNIERRSRL